MSPEVVSQVTQSIRGGSRERGMDAFELQISEVDDTSVPISEIVDTSAVIYYMGTVGLL